MKNEIKENKKRKKRKYRTHPIIKALLSLFILISVLSVSGAYFAVKKAEEISAEYSRKLGEARYEAYLEFCERILSGDGAGAVGALSRYELFSEGETEATEILSNFLRNGTLRDSDMDELYEILTEYGQEPDTALMRASETVYDRVHERGALPTSGSSEEWTLLRERAEVTSEEARSTARRFIGGGAALTESESHAFPLVYVYSCENAVAEISRMGGRLISMWRYPLGDLEERGVEACRAAARRFISDTGIKEACLVSEELIGEEVRFLFCGTVTVGDEEAIVLGERIEVTAVRSGARITGFDATEYYRRRSTGRVSGDISVSRERAEEILETRDVRLIYSEGEFFWEAVLGASDTAYGTQSGAKNHIISAETGDFTVKNP